MRLTIRKRYVAPDNSKEPAQSFTILLPTRPPKRIDTASRRPSGWPCKAEMFGSERYFCAWPLNGSS